MQPFACLPCQQGWLHLAVCSPYEKEAGGSRRGPLSFSQQSTACQPGFLYVMLCVHTGIYPCFHVLYIYSGQTQWAEPPCALLGWPSPGAPRPPEAEAMGPPRSSLCLCFLPPLRTSVGSPRGCPDRPWPWPCPRGALPLGQGRTQALGLPRPGSYWAESRPQSRQPGYPAGGARCSEGHIRPIRLG